MEETVSIEMNMTANAVYTAVLSETTVEKADEEEGGNVELPA